jgi:hypothetical protein
LSPVPTRTFDEGQGNAAWRQESAPTSRHQGFIDAFTRYYCRDIFDPLNAVTYSQGEA